jgi:hypothetical protein
MVEKWIFLTPVVVDAEGIAVDRNTYDQDGIANQRWTFDEGGFMKARVSALDVARDRLVNATHYENYKIVSGFSDQAGAPSAFSCSVDGVDVDSPDDAIKVNGSSP